ncbi:MAG TPA: L-seryl-tRNA(Sec) selenium transferase [Pyrinomonadaceae bacterium]|nr:L-seryl-tRNA(Sec) selenium transferase [Pyrinomonadaceae bacterium]
MPDRLSTENLRALPSVDALLRTPEAQALRATLGARHLTALARAVTDAMRDELRSRIKSNSTGGERESHTLSEAQSRSDDELARESLLAEAARRLALVAVVESARGLRRVINATGVVLHTNLGRAPLSAHARRAVAEEAAGYCTLEYDTEAGGRGRRGARVEELLAELTVAESALVVNNCAAGALLVLSALARGGEAIVSRGELVEIGGDFRVPDVMAESGASMVEVGTTNRTRLADYERAITERTRMILRVHPSNYRIVGFTSGPALDELAGLAHERGLLLYEDAGSGALFDLSTQGIAGEPLIGESVARGADVVTFSGDKLLGGPQAGLVVGRSEIVERLRRHPLYRALRADKLALAALEATLQSYRRGDAAREVPALRMLAATREEIERRARAFVRRLRERVSDDSLVLEIVEGRSAVGGGSAPTTHPPTALVALKHTTLSASALDERLRRAAPPVVARILDDRVVLDLRTVAEEEEAELLDALASVRG